MSKETQEILLIGAVVLAAAALVFSIYESTKPKPAANDLTLGQLAQLGAAVAAAL